jgi:hypothetical protein
VKAQVDRYEASNFTRVVACTGSVGGLCEAKDRNDAHASAVVPRPRAKGSSADGEDPRDQDEAAEVATATAGKRRIRVIKKNPLLLARGFSFG